MNAWIRRTRGAALLAVLLAAPGCASVGLGTLEDILGEMGGMDLPGTGLRGEVRWVDRRRQEIGLDTRQSGEEVVSYDSRTEVVYQRQRYTVDALERGDLVSVQLQRGSRRGLHADRIQVERTARGSGGGGGDWESSGRVQTFEGRVRWIDLQRGQFGLDARYGGTQTVSLPYNPGRSVTDRFRRLRQGDRVRLEGEVLNQSRIELRRFL